MLCPSLGPVSDYLTNNPKGLSRAHLLGRAGTGKSYQAAKLLEWANEQGLNMRLCSFTNEIAGQLPYGVTIHRMFNLVFNGTHTIVRSSNPCHHIDIIGIDEYTLIDRALWRIIQERIKGTRCKLLLIGDPYQLPPVRGKPSIPMTPHDTFELTTQYRNPDMQQLIDWCVWHVVNKQKPSVDDLKRVCKHGHISDFIGIDGSDFKGHHPMILGYTNKIFHEIDDQYPLLDKKNWNLCTPIGHMPIGTILPRTAYQGFRKDVIPEWSLTVHKSQGKTLKGSPLVLIDNVMKAPSNLLPQMVYVACTRGTELPTLVHTG